MGHEPGIVGLFGLFGIGNIGNDGSLEAMVRCLRRITPDERLVCICGEPAVVGRAFGLDAIPIYSRPRALIGGRVGAFAARAAGRATLWVHAARHLRQMKVLIVPGMGVLDDFAVSPLGWPHDILSWCLLGRLMGVKIIFASIGAGPIRHPLSRFFMKAAARAAHYRSYRDMLSKTFMESIGFDTRNDPIYPDLAFALPAPTQVRRQQSADEPLVIGVGVMTYHGWRNHRGRGANIYASYLEKMTSFVVWLLGRGHLVRLLMGDEVDRRVANDVLRAVRSRRPDCAEDAIVFAPAYTLHDVMRQMADTDLVVATRYHNVVCALRIGKPTISIGYAKKNDVLLAEVGLGDYCQQVEDLDVDVLKKQTEQMIANRHAVEARVREAAVRFESKLREQEERLASLIGSASSTAPRTESLDLREPAV
jgi:polysaccharide pyruvyl transferase WcaK-like protein